MTTAGRISDPKEAIVALTGEDLSFDEIIEVGRRHKKADIDSQSHIAERMNASVEVLQKAIKNKQMIYGVTSNFGGLATEYLNREERSKLQESLVWGLKCGVGKPLPQEHIRACMLMRANTLLKGASGIRIEVVETLLKFLNADMVPLVKEYGSIGASGDLVPLAYIAGAITGLDSSYKVVHQGREIDAISALALLGLQPTKLREKEALALVNGTSMMTGTAAFCVHDASTLFNINLHVHALMAQAMLASSESFDVFVHRQKPHPGQVRVAEKMRHLLADSHFILPIVHDPSVQNANAMAAEPTPERPGRLFQDRYSIRCLPQYLGVIVESLETMIQHVEIEANSANDNPMIDIDNQALLHAGNFLGEHIAISMDQLRHYLGLMAKHMDAQIALLVSPHFNHGLPPSLAGTVERGDIKYGLNGLQICANSIMPLIVQNARSIADLYPTHAEMFNQNINSQGFNAANLTWHSIELMRHYLSISIIFAVQAMNLRSFVQYNNYDSRAYISPALIPFYEAIYEAVGRSPGEQDPFIHKSTCQPPDVYIEDILKDIKSPANLIIQALQ